VSRRLWCLITTAALVVSGIAATPAHAQPAPDRAADSACALAADPQVRQLISGPGAVALAEQCDRERGGEPLGTRQPAIPEGQFSVEIGLTSTAHRS
jgi:hypothetical protein